VGTCESERRKNLHWMNDHTVVTGEADLMEESKGSIFKSVEKHQRDFFYSLARVYLGTAARVLTFKVVL